ncbi:MAG: hypothetical protein SF123_17460 [Chloroflexota bacterium]|nr:hypothetical protein [Chloroflexota bacterium]
MNNRIVIGLIIALLGIALVLLFLQTQSLNQSQESLTSLQASATAQAQAASAAATQAVESQAIAVADAQNLAATAQAEMLALAGNNAATAQATAVAGAQAEGANAVATAESAGATAAAGTAVAQSDAFATQEAVNATAEARSEVLEADIAQGQAAATARSVNATAAVALTDAAVVLESAQVNVATARANDAIAADNAAATQVAAVSTEAAVTFGNEMDMMQGQVAATQRSVQATLVVAESGAATAIAEGDAALEAAGDKFATEQAEMQATIAVLETQVAEGGVGSAPGETPAPSSADVPEDWVRLVGNGVSMALPESWLGGFLPGNRDLFNDMVDAFGEDLIASVRDNQDDNGDTFLFVALDTNTPINDGLSAAQVLLLTDGVTDSIDEVVDNIASDDAFWENYDIQDTGVIELPNYEAGFVLSETDQFGIDQTQIDYYIVVDEVLYNVRFFASTREYEDALEDVWALAVTTLEIGAPK